MVEEVRIEDAAERHLDDVCRFCIPPPRQSDPAFVQGEGCVVNARLIKAFVLDRQRFREEVAAALMAP